MRTIKWIDEQELATEQHNPVIKGKRNVDVIVSARCNQKCPYCKSYVPFIKPELTQDEDYNMELANRLNNLDANTYEISITGGEPTLEPERLVATMQLVHRLGYTTRTFSTTGEGLFEKVEGREVCEHMVENGFTHNISLNRFVENDEENQHIMNGEKSEQVILKPVLTNRQIQRLAMFFRLNDAQLRMSCPVIGGGVDCLERMIEYAEFYDRMGVNHVLFREITDYEQNKPVIDLRDIFELIGQNEQFLKVEQILTEHYTIDVYRYRNKIVKCYSSKTLLTL